MRCGNVDRVQRGQNGLRSGNIYDLVSCHQIQMICAEYVTSIDDVIHSNQREAQVGDWSCKACQPSSRHEGRYQSTGVVPDVVGAEDCIANRLVVGGGVNCSAVGEVSGEIEG